MYVVNSMGGDTMAIPEPGTKEYENMVEFMRQDLASGGALTNIILTARKLIEADGKDFDKAFAKWVEKRKKDRSGIKSWKDTSPPPKIKFKNLK